MPLDQEIWDLGARPKSQGTVRQVNWSDTVRTGLGADAIATALIDNLYCIQGKPPQYATRNDWYMALA